MNSNESPLLPAAELCHFRLPQIPGHMGIPSDEHTKLQLTQATAHFPQLKAGINILRRPGPPL